MNGMKRMVPITNAYVVNVMASYFSNNFFPTMLYIAQHKAESIIKESPTFEKERKRTI